jgi:THO complex subunit 3
MTLQDDTIFKISRSTNSVISSHAQPIQTNHIIYSWSGKELFLTGGDGTIKILDSASMDLLYSFRAHTSSCFSLDYCPDGRYLAVGGTDALVTLWDTTEWMCKRSLNSLIGPVRTVSFSWDGGYITAGGEEDKGLEIFHVDSGESLHKIDCGAAPVVQWSPKDHSLAFALHESAGGGLRIINAATLI